MNDIERVSRVGTYSTNKTVPESIAAIQQAIESVGRVNLAKARISEITDSTIDVEIRPTSPVGIAADNTWFSVTCRDDEDQTEVKVEVTDYTPYQQKMFGFIPVGPKMVAGWKVYERCLDAIDAAL